MFSMSSQCLQMDSGVAAGGGAVEGGGRLTDVEMSHILRWVGWLKQPSALRPTVQPSVARGGGGLRASCVWILGILAS